MPKWVEQIFPMGKGGFLVYWVETQLRRSYVGCVCRCGKKFTVRTDSSLLTRQTCGKCPPDFNMLEDKAEVYFVGNGGEKLTLVLDLESVGLIKNLSNSKVSVRKMGTGRQYYAFYEDKGKTKSLHRLIMNTPPDMVVDHISGDGLDCRKANMRNVTRDENSRNLPKPQTNTSGHIGVCLRKSGKYYAYIWNQSRQVPLGTYSDFFDAICARKSAENRLNYHVNHGR